LLLTEDI